MFNDVKITEILCYFKRHTHMNSVRKAFLNQMVLPCLYNLCCLCAKLIYLAVSAVVMQWVETGSTSYALTPASLADFDIGVGVHAPLVGSMVLVAKFKGSRILQS